MIIIINQSIKRRRRRSTCTQKYHLNTSRSTGSDPFFVCLKKLLHRFHDLNIYIYKKIKIASAEKKIEKNALLCGVVLPGNQRRNGNDKKRDKNDDLFILIYIYLFIYFIQGCYRKFNIYIYSVVEVFLNFEFLFLPLFFYPIFFFL